MVRINDSSIDDFLGKTQETLQNSLIETGYSFTYTSGTINYTLPGFAIGNERIFSIESIEGTGFLPEDYITEDDLIEGTDYTLYDGYASEERVPFGYGAASDSIVYTGISIFDQTFKAGSTIHIKYKYQNPNYVPILTNFSPNSVLRMILTASLLNMQLTNSELVQSIETFGLNATGDDLDRLATIVGLIRTSATSTTGQVRLVNNGTEQYTFSPSHRFATLSGGTFLAFAPITGISVPIGGESTAVYIDTRAIESGSLYNIGSNAIAYGFTDINLTTRIPTTVTVSNPPLGDLGQPNLFNDGTNDEPDKDFRKRISLTFSQAKTSSYSTIEKAALDTNLVKEAKVFDTDNKKDLETNEVQTYLATDTGARLASSSLSQILDAIINIKPAGSRPSVRQTLNTYINFDFNIYVSQNTLGDTTALETQLITLLDDYINDKGIGEDILPSSVVSIVKGLSNVLDVEINTHTVTEFASEVATYNNQIDIAIANADVNYVAIEVPFNSATYLHNEVESGMSGTLELISGAHAAPNDLPFPVDARTPPRVNIGVIAYDGIVRPSALDRTDYRLGGDRDTITYDYQTLGGDIIKTTDLVLFNYNYFDNMLIDGFRIRLGGTAGAEVEVDFGWTAANDPDTFASIITPVVITLDGTERLYDVPLAVQENCDNDPTYSPDGDNFWLILKQNTSSVGDSYLPVDDQQSYVAFNPRIFEDADQNDAYETFSFNRANWHSYTTFTNADAYKKIVIPSQTDEPENPVSYIHTFTFSKYEEE